MCFTAIKIDVGGWPVSSVGLECCPGNTKVAGSIPPWATVRCALKKKIKKFDVGLLKLKLVTQVTQLPLTKCLLLYLSLTMTL